MPTIQYIQGQPFLIPDDATGVQQVLPTQYASLTPPNQIFAQEQPNVNILPAEQDYWNTQEKAGMQNVFSGLSKPVKKLLGVGGEERYQTWPERTIRSALTLPAEVYKGEVLSCPGLRREDYTDIPIPTDTTQDSTWLGRKLGIAPVAAQPLDPMMERAQDVAGLAGGTMFAGVKPGVASLGAGPVRKAVTETIEKAPTFYSNVEKAVKNAKMNVGISEQWLGYLRNQPGVKPEELQWTIGQLPQGKLTKQQVEQHVAENKVQLGEIVKADISGPNYISSTEINSNKPKYQSYQLPGGENYREVLLTLPEKDNPAKIRYKEIDKRLEEIQNKFDELYNQNTIEANTSRELLANEKKKLVKESVKLQQELFNPSNNINFKSSHWDEPNVLAHIRMNDREIPDVGKSLHIEEIQSDWHQAGRKEGYVGSLEEFNKLDKQLNDARQLLSIESEKTATDVLGSSWQKFRNENRDPHIREQALQKLNEYRKDIPSYIEAEKKVNELEQARNRANPAGRVPDAPFKKTWDELAIKRAIKEAVDNDYDAISWTPGEAQAARYDLSKHVNNIEIKKEGENKHIVINAKSGVVSSGLVDQSGKIVQGYDLMRDAIGKPLSDVVGKEVADKILASKENTKLEKLDLKVGGEGMKAFYDKMMVDKVNNLAKKFDGKVETKELGGTITKELKNGEYIVKNNGKEVGRFDNRNDAQELVNELIEAGGGTSKPQPVHVLKLTPELKKQVSEKGFPLFTGGLEFPKPIEQPTFDERWRERVPEDQFMEDKEIGPYPTNRQAPGRFNDKRPIRLTKMPNEFEPEF